MTFMYILFATSCLLALIAELSKIEGESLWEE